MKRLFFLLLLASHFVSAQPNGAASGRRQLRADAAVSTSDALVSAQQEFGITLLKEAFRKSPTDNILLSPVSVFSALMLVLEGTAGTTKSIVSRTLHTGNISADSLRAAVARQLWRLHTDSGSSTILRLSSAIWADSAFPLSPAYAAQTRQYYQAEARRLNFAAAGSVDSINKTVSSQTNGRIPRIIDRAALFPPIVLTNAIYFNGRWSSEFNSAATRLKKFRAASGQAQTAAFMSQRSTRLGYLRGLGWQAVRLYYAGVEPSISMEIFVPDNLAGLPDFIAALTPQSWATWQRQFESSYAPTEVDLQLPRFRLDWQQNLVPFLNPMGLAPATGDQADFSPMGFRPEAPGRIGSIVHKTYMAVDEQGTEATAATAIEIITGFGRAAKSPRRVKVSADHPFFYAIVDNRTGAMLFAGLANSISN